MNGVKTMFLVLVLAASAPDSLTKKQSIVKNVGGVAVDFNPHELDLAKLTLNEEKLKIIKEEDIKNVGAYFKNVVALHTTKKGVFRVVSSFGRLSVDPESGSYGGEQIDTMQLPNGKWVAIPSQIQQFMELGGETYLICRRFVLKVVSAEKIVVVVSFIGAETIEGSITNDDQNSAYFEICKPIGPDFAGLLEYVNGGQWKFHCYRGKYGGRLRKIRLIRDVPNHLIIYLFNWHNRARQIIGFNPFTNNFTDL